MGKYIEGKEGSGKEYFAAVNNLTQVYQDELLAKIGFKFNPKTGKFTVQNKTIKNPNWTPNSPPNVPKFITVPK